MPLWIWLVFIGIVISAIMAIRTARQERLIENAWIEEEGQKYMERMRIEQEKRGMAEKKEYSESEM
jgi:cell division protein FtsL